MSRVRDYLQMSKLKPRGKQTVEDVKLCLGFLLLVSCIPPDSAALAFCCSFVLKQGFFQKLNRRDTLNVIFKNVLDVDPNRLSAPSGLPVPSAWSVCIHMCRINEHSIWSWEALLPTPAQPMTMWPWPSPTASLGLFGVWTLNEVPSLYFQHSWKAAP